MVLEPTDVKSGKQPWWYVTKTDAQALWLGRLWAALALVGWVGVALDDSAPVFMGIMAVWILINCLVLYFHPFDPYPFILLNLVLSCLASLQAPVIMMSQNRQEPRDRLHANNDYLVNLKAELEIRQLNAKMDQLLTHQWQRLMEIQEIQTELMQEVIQGSGRKPSPGPE